MPPKKKGLSYAKTRIKRVRSIKGWKRSKGRSLKNVSRPAKNMWRRKLNLSPLEKGRVYRSSQQRQLIADVTTFFPTVRYEDIPVNYTTHYGNEVEVTMDYQGKTIFQGSTVTPSRNGKHFSLYRDTHKYLQIIFQTIADLESFLQSHGFASLKENEQKKDNRTFTIYGVPTGERVPIQENFKEDTLDYIVDHLLRTPNARFQTNAISNKIIIFNEHGQETGSFIFENKNDIREYIKQNPRISANPYTN